MGRGLDVFFFQKIHLPKKNFEVQDGESVRKKNSRKMKLGQVGVGTELNTHPTGWVGRGHELTIPLKGHVTFAEIGRENVFFKSF